MPDSNGDHSRAASGLLSATATITGPTSASWVVRVDGSLTPAERTDFVFILDASPTMQASIASGQLASAAADVLEYVSRFDDDGIDFFLASAVQPDSRGFAELKEHLARGAAPPADVVVAAHGATSVGQCVDRDDIDRVLGSPDLMYSVGSVLAPALRAAREIRKPRGRLFIEILTDCRPDDLDALVTAIAEMSQDCKDGGDEGRYRLHILAVGDVDKKTMDYLDDGLGDVAPIDIVASTVAAETDAPAKTIFKEMQAYMTNGDLGFIEARAPGLKSMTLNGEPMEDQGGNCFSSAFERLPLEMNLDASFDRRPSALSLELVVGGLDPITAEIGLG